MAFPVIFSRTRERSYLQKVLSIERANLIGCWLQKEASGSTSVDSSPEGNDGAYTGVTLGQGGVPGMGYTSPLYDGTLDFNNLQSAGFASDFDGKEGSLITWAKVSSGGVWTDDSYDRIISFYDDADNFISIVKWNTDNLVNYYYKANGTQVSVAKSSISDTGWVCWGATWSKTAASGNGEFKAYFNGAQHGATNVMDNFAGAPTQSLLGSWTTPPNQPWNGWLGPAMLWTTPLTAAQMAYLSKV